MCGEKAPSRCIELLPRPEVMVSVVSGGSWFGCPLRCPRCKERDALRGGGDELSNLDTTSLTMTSNFLLVKTYAIKNLSRFKVRLLLGMFF